LAQKKYTAVYSARYIKILIALNNETISQYPLAATVVDLSSDVKLDSFRNKAAFAVITINILVNKVVYMFPFIVGLSTKKF